MTATTKHQPIARAQTISRRSPEILVRGWVLALSCIFGRAARTLRVRAAAARADESGNVITDNLAWIVFGVIITVAIAALIKVLGATVLNWVETQLGVG